MKRLATLLLVALLMPLAVVFAAAVFTLTDDFNDNSFDTGKWSMWSDNVSETNQQLEITKPGGAFYKGVSTTAGYDFDESSVFVQVVDAGDQSQASSESYPIYFENTVDSGDRITWAILNGTLYAITTVNDSGTNVRANVSYDSAVHKWFRLREASGTTYWDYSTDGSTWTNYTSVATPGGIDHTSMLVVMGLGSWASTAETKGIWDNLNVPPAGCNPAIEYCTDTFTTAGFHSWTAPADVYNADVACWGGGGGGGDGTNTGGGGGGGGAFASSTVAVTPSTSYTIFVGLGGARGASAAAAGSTGATSTFSTTTVVASPGLGGSGGSSADASGGAGGATTTSVGTVMSKGGNGGIGRNTGDSSGGGGGAGGPHGNDANGGAGDGSVGGAGGQGSNTNGGTSGSSDSNGSTAPPGGNGGASAYGGGGGGGGDDGDEGGNGGAPGGGGGGGENNSAVSTQGNGADGQCMVVYTAGTPPEPPTESILQSFILIYQ